MENLNNSQKAFFELLRAGLWEQTYANLNLGLNDKVDWDEVYRLATEQSVMGLVLAGIEKTNTNRTDNTNRLPQELLLQWIGEVQIIEEQNKDMNVYLAQLIDKLRKADVYAILVKGQGIAQCYEKPLWRSSGDVDLLLSDSNYEKAKAFLIPLASDVEQEYTYFKHQGMTIDGWDVELHGTLHGRLSARVDRMLDEVQKAVFCGGKVRSWQNGRTHVFLPAPDEDVIFVFTHILHHFFFEGIGLRQICDWCRLLWTYRNEIDHRMLELRLRKAGIMTEWKVFASLAVNWLGMPVDTMPLYDANERWRRKAERAIAFVMEVGNFGYNKMVHGERFMVKGYFWRKFVSFWGRLSDMLRHFRIFPLDSIRFFGGVLRSGLHAAVRGE